MEWKTINKELPDKCKPLLFCKERKNNDDPWNIQIGWWEDYMFFEDFEGYSDREFKYWVYIEEILKYVPNPNQPERSKREDSSNGDAVL